MEIEGCLLHTTSPASWTSRTPTTPCPPRTPPPHACVASATTPESRKSGGCGHGGRFCTTGSTRLLILECCVALVTLTIYPLEYFFCLVFFTVVLLLSALWSPPRVLGLRTVCSWLCLSPAPFFVLINEVVTALSLRFIPPQLLFEMFSNTSSECEPCVHLLVSKHAIQALVISHVSLSP